MKLLMIVVGRILAQGKKGPFYYLLEEFSKYWDRIDVICPRIEQGDYNIHKNVYVHGFPRLMWRQPWFIFKKGLEIYRKEKFDLFTVHNDPPFYNDIGGYWLHKKTKVPYVLEVMHIAGDPKLASFKEWFYKLLERLFVNFFAKNAKAVRIINKKQTGEFLKKSGVDEKKLKYIPAFYIDFNVFYPQNLDKKYDIVFSGRLVKNKGIFLLLEAIKIIRESQPTAGHPQCENVKLIIIGSGPLENKIKKYIYKHNLQDNITFAGWLPSIEGVAKIYNQSEIMVMPSFNEGGPRVTLEAMNCKVPVITSRVGIMLDIIQNKENGLFIDWNVKDIAEKIKLLLEDDDLRKKIAENGYKTAQQFERKKAIKNYAEFYKNLLHNS
jgi:glycosyltransferase involved in cell wall biosynthesis